MNVISMALWGSDDKYIQGVIENSRLAEEIYPGWAIWLSVPRGKAWHHIAQTLIAERCVMPILTSNINYVSYTEEPEFGLFNRFMAVGCTEYDHVIIRDADSRLNWREKAAVDEWIESGKTFHVMRDNPAHRRPMLGGMWGCKGGAIPDIGDKIKAWLGDRPVQHDMDQHFLADVVWPEARRNCLIHDSQMFKESYLQATGPRIVDHTPPCPYPGEEHGPLLGFGCTDRQIDARPFPPHADIAPSRFVGDVILADGTPDPSIKDPGVL